MAAKRKTRKYSPELRAAVLADAAKTSGVAAAKLHKVPLQTIYAWAMRDRKANGGGKAHAKNGKARAKPLKIPRASNGHATVSPTPLSGAGLDGLHAQLSTALASVTAMRDAFRTVFGGERE